MFQLVTSLFDRGRFYRGPKNGVRTTSLFSLQGLAPPLKFLQIKIFFMLQTNHDLKILQIDHNLPLWCVLCRIYLRSTDPTQETYPRACRLYAPLAATGAVDHTGHTYRSYISGIYLP